MKVLLINPTAAAWRVQRSASPPRATRIFRFSMLSSLYVATAMPPGVETRIVDEEVEPVDLETNADLIGISFMTFNAPRAYALADHFRLRRGKVVIFGGYHPTLLPEEAIQHADAVCIGEAEPNVPEMIHDFRRGRLRSFYRNGAADLRRLPIPDRRLLHRSAYAIADAVQATRGCPHACTFCSISAFFGRRFRVRPVEEVIDELKSLRRHVIFMDDNLTADPEYAKDLFARMIPLKKRWVSQASTTIGRDPELIHLAARSGCCGLFLGLESLPDQGLADCNKRFNHARDYARLVRGLHDHRIGVIAGIVFGHDVDTPEVFPRTLRFLEETRIDALQATILTPFPGTALHRQLVAEGRIVDRDWVHYDFAHAVFEPKGMSRATLMAGHRWVLREFYSKRAVWRRLAWGATYLAAGDLWRTSAALNLSYRARLRVAGILNASETDRCPEAVGGPASTASAGITAEAVSVSSVL
jgi:radical SAM superfamily enzyme YgiQ (UPF0313 family)